MDILEDQAINEIKFTPKLLNAALEKYVLRTKYTEKEREYVLNQKDDFDVQKTLEYLIDNSEGRLDIYAPADELFKNLKILTSFTDNSEYLGVVGDRMNFEQVFWMHEDTEKTVYLMKYDIPLFLYHNLKVMCKEDEISLLFLKTVGNKLYRKLKNTLEYVPKDIVTEMHTFLCDILQNSIAYYYFGFEKEEGFDFIEYDVEEVFSCLSKFYDKNEDEEFLHDLRKQIEITVKNKPIKSNEKYYQNVLFNHRLLANVLKTTIAKFPFIFQLYNPEIKDFPHYPVVRMLEFSGMKYFFAKELQLALRNRKNVKIEVETEEDRKNGIILTVAYDAFLNILKEAGLTEKDVNIVPQVVNMTYHRIITPINTAYGTHCKMAMDVWYEIFKIFTIDIRWFDTVSEKNFYKLVNWFDSLDDVFSDTRQGIWYVELWKIDELKNQVYEQFKKYTRKPKYDPPNITRYMTRELMFDEIQKFRSLCYSMKMDQSLWRKMWLDRQKCRNMTKWDILAMYDDCWRTLFISQSKRFVKFAISGSMFLSARSKQVPVLEIPIERTTMHYVNRLEAHPISYLSRYKYSMTTVAPDCFYENDICLSLALDKTIDDETVKSKIISLIYKAENKKYETNQKRSVFYLNESEFHEFCARTRENFEEYMNGTDALEVDLNLEKYATSTEKRREINRICKIHFPVNEYSRHFHESLREILKNEENVEELINIALRARKIFEECSEEMRSFKDYCRGNKKRRIVMRIMTEMRIDDQKEWHMFSDDVLEAIEIVLENEGKLESKKDQIENWRQKWKNEDSFTTVTVKLFETMLNVLGIANSNFMFVPDVQVYKNIIELPLKMGYNAMKVLSPDGREVYHQVQAQFLIFQYGACDVFWNSDDKKAKNKHKKKVLDEMKKIGKGYTLAENVEESVRRLMYSDVAQKTPLSGLHGEIYNSVPSKEEFREINKFFSKFKMGNLLTCQCKVFLMSVVLESILKKNSEELELQKNIYKAFSVSFGSVVLKNLEDFENWFALGLQGSHYIKWDLIKALESAKTEYESMRKDYDPKELIEQHYLFDETDPLGTPAKKKIGTRKNRVFGSEEKVEQNHSDIDKILDIIPEVIESIADEVFEPIDKLWEMLDDYIQKEFDEEEAVILCKTLKTTEGCSSIKIDLVEYIDITMVDGIEMYKKKKVEEPEKKVKPKKEEGPKIVVKYVTETKTVENCVNCRSIEKETMGFERKIEKLEKENEEYQKIIRQNEEDLSMLKNQISQNKLKYREEIQKHKEDVEGREVKIEQLNQEIKEYREDSRIERENLYSEVRMSSRKADESVKKMKIELENSKFLEKAKNKKIDELTAENSHLKTSLEIAEEKLDASERAKEDAENLVRLLEKQLEAIPDFSEDVFFEKDLYLNPEMRVEPFEEILQFDVYGILEKISKISEKYGISKSEIVRFQRRYDMYIRILENENCWETAEIPDFPVSFSADFMQNYEWCLKEMK